MNFIEATFQGAIVCRNYSKTWSFPREVSDLMERETAGKSVLQMYGGFATFGVRMDADPATRPDIIGNAFYPPLRCESFDVVIVDPPYKSIYNMPLWSLMPAACIARERVWWFHTHYAGYVNGMKPRRWWSVLPSQKAPLRVLIEFERMRHPKLCVPPESWRCPVEIQPYNWSRDLRQRPLVFGA